MTYTTIIPGSKDKTLDFAVKDWLDCARVAIETKGRAYIALSGGSTPKAIYQKFKKQDLDWSKVELYFSDERVVPINDPQSNFKMAWEAGFKNLVLPRQIHAMYKGGKIDEAASKYEETLPERFDLIMLGMGNDAHIASLFPQTHGLNTQGDRVVANYLPEKEVWRITFTYEELEQTDRLNIYVLGEDKAEILKTVIDSPYDYTKYPIQRALKLPTQVNLILDDRAASMINSSS
jgi:6-phosphogluconolactonase